MNDFQKYCCNRIKYGFFRFIFFILFAIIVFSLGNKLNLFADKVYALEGVTIYRNASFSNTGFLYTTDSSLSGTIKNGSINTLYADPSYGITFFINKGSVVGRVYKVRVNFNDYDFLHSNTHNTVSVTNGDSCAIVGFELLNQGGQANQAKGIDVSYTCLNSGSYVGVTFGQYIDGEGYKRITTINWRINSVQWEEVDATQSQLIIANASQNTQNIINNNNTNTQNIINNQNQNTQNMIDSQKSCTLINNENIVKENKYLTSNGNENNSNGWGITDYINIYNANVEFTNYGFSTSTQTCFYDTNKTLISCSNNYTLESFSIPTNSVFMRMSILNSTSMPRAKICKNGNQALNDNISDLKDSLTDDSPVNMDSLGNTAGWLPPGPVDSIINLPLNLFNSLLTALNKSCAPINIPLPYVNKTMEVPCISTLFNKITGLPSFWTWVGVIASVVILYNYLISLYKYYDDLTTLKANFIDDFGGAP